MGKIKSITNYLIKENYFSIYLSIFRVFLVVIIFNKIYNIWSNQSILISKNGFFVQSRSVSTTLGNFNIFFIENIQYFLLSVILMLVFLLFGIGRKITALIIFIQFSILQTYTTPILNGGDNLLTFLLLYFMLTNSYNYLVLNKSNKQNTQISNLLSNISVYSMLIHLCYVYFISGIHKLHSDVWFNGTALYYILSIERFQSNFCYLIKDNGFIVTISTYFIIFFEIFFCILIWLKYFRNFMLISGIILHLGIFIFMMIFDFEIIFISTYGFFLTNTEWENTLNRLINLPIIRKYA